MSPPTSAAASVVDPRRQDLARWSRSLDVPGVALFDLDGTLWHWGNALPDAASTLTALRQAGWRTGVVTNNSFSTSDQIHQRMRSAGLDVDVVVGVVDAACRAVAELAPGGRILGIGSDVLHDALHAAGLQVVASAPADVVVVGNDLGLSHESLSRGLAALLDGAQLVALNLDRFYIGAGGEPRVGGGTLAQALAYASGHPIDVLLGKPAPHLIHDALGHFRAAAADCVYVGDSLDTDVAAAVAAGTRSVLVRSGVAARSGKDDPDAPTRFVPLQGLAEVAAALLGPDHGKALDPDER